MPMKNLFFTLFIILTGCGTYPYYETQKDFFDYVNRFEQDTGKKVNIPIIFTDEDKYAGVCEYYSNGNRLVRINHKYWHQSDDSGKEQLIYHELGHCVLNREHSTKSMNLKDTHYNIPNSIMYPIAFGDLWYYSFFRNHYIDELIHPDKNL